MRIVVSDTGLDLAAELAGWPAGDELDCAALGVAPEERALRTPENFDPFDIAELDPGTGRAADRHAVGVDGDALLDETIGGARCRHAAHVERKGSVRSRERNDHQARRGRRRQVREAGDALVSSARLSSAVTAIGTR